MKFPTQYTETPRMYCNSGSKIVKLYKPQFDKNGHFELVEDGEDNLYEMIQSYKDSVDIHVLMKRFENGDIDALNKREGFYADISEYPTSYAQMFNLMQSAEDNFMQLPPDIREKFNNNFKEYLVESQENSSSFLSKLGISNSREDVIPSAAPSDDGDDKSGK